MTRIPTVTAGIAVTVFAAFIYGFYPAAARAAYASGANVVFMIMLALLWRSVAMSFFCIASRQTLFADRQAVKDAAVNGAYQFAQLGCILWAMIYLPGPVVITVMFSYATLLYLYMVMRGEEPFSVSVFCTVVAALAGIALVMNIFHEDAGNSALGLFIAAVSAIISAARIYVFGNTLKTRNPAVVGAETFTFALIFSCLLAFYTLPVFPQTTQGWAWAMLGGASLAMGGFGALYGIKLLGAFRFAFFIKLEPVFGAILSAVLIHEILGVTQYAGIALVVGSLLAYQLMQKKGTA